MLSLLYPISYFISLGGLIAWFYYQEDRSKSRLMSKLFLGGFFVYTFSLAFAEADLSYKLLILFRDLFVLGIVSQCFNFFRKNKIVFYIMMVVLFGFSQIKGFQILQQTFPQTMFSQNELASDAELLIELSENHQIKELQSILNEFDLTSQKAFSPLHINITELDDYYTIDIPENKLDQLEKIKEALSHSNIVDYFEENEVILLDDPSPSSNILKSKRSFGINDPGLENLWGFDVMNIDKLYQFLATNKIKPQRKARVAILDTGVDAKHEDLADNYKSIQTKYDSDKMSHGTHCAGIAAAVSNNKVGIASFSMNNEFIEISSIKVLSDSGMGTQKKIIDGIIEAADNNVDVISLSLGGPSSANRQRTYNKAIKYANKAGAIVVVAAGNSNADAKRYSPANTDGVICISAINKNLERAPFSNYVSNVKMGLAAPGVDIYSTVPQNKYATFSGTSMATPYVAGLIGLMKSIRPDLETKEVYKLLSETGIDTKATSETGMFIQPEKVIKALVK